MTSRAVGDWVVDGCAVETTASEAARSNANASGAESEVQAAPSSEEATMNEANRWGVRTHISSATSAESEVSLGVVLIVVTDHFVHDEAEELLAKRGVETGVVGQ